MLLMWKLGLNDRRTWGLGMLVISVVRVSLRLSVLLRCNRSMILWMLVSSRWVSRRFPSMRLSVPLLMRREVILRPTSSVARRRFSRLRSLCETCACLPMCDDLVSSMWAV